MISTSGESQSSVKTRDRLTTYPKTMLDVKSSYPYGQSVFNMSKTTTKKELVSIEGVEEEERRMCGINLSGGRTNAVEIATKLFKVPTMLQMLEAYKQEEAIN